MSIDSEDTQPIMPPPPPGGDDAPWVGPCLANYPCGKGVFVRDVDHGGPPALFAERCEWLGFKWVMLQAAWAKPDRLVVNNPNQLLDYSLALRDRGIVPWIWGWPTPERAAPWLGAVMHAVHQTNAPGIVINPEHPWRKGHREDAHRFMQMCRAALGDRMLGMTSYGGGPGYIKSFPWDEFASADFAIPQWYDMNHRLGPKFPVQAARRWIAGGYKILIPALGAGDRHDRADMHEHFSQTPFPVSACCWWDLYWIMRSKSRAQAVRELQIPPVTTGGGGAIA